MHPTIEAIQKGNLKKVPEVKTGYTVEVSQKVTEGTKERIQKFKGLVIKISHGAGVEKTFTVRKIVEGIGVEKIFPFHSPNVTKIHIVKKAKVRRQKLYYMRQRFGKSARLSERHVTDEERAAEEAKMEALYAEAVKADEKKVAEEAKKDEGGEAPVETPDKPQSEESESGARLDRNGQEATEDGTSIETPEAPKEEVKADVKEEAKKDDTDENEKAE